MADITLIENEYITMQYLEDRNTIFHVIHQPISGQPLRDALMTGFNALEDYGATKWVSDDRKNGPMTPEDTRWNRQNLNNAIVGTGWKYWALVVPEQVVAAGSMLPTMEELFEDGLRVMVFSDVGEAFEWIDSFED